jgi:hypothetical protein
MQNKTDVFMSIKAVGVPNVFIATMRIRSFSSSSTPIISSLASAHISNEHEIVKHSNPLVNRLIPASLSAASNETDNESREKQIIKSESENPIEYAFNLQAEMLEIREEKKANNDSKDKHGKEKPLPNPKDENLLEYIARTRAPDPDHYFCSLPLPGSQSQKITGLLIAENIATMNRKEQKLEMNYEIKK